MIFMLAFLFEKLTHRPDLWVKPLSWGPELCARVIPAGEFSSLDLALICGANIPPGTFKQAVLDTGLIHLMVVSGSHLVFLDAILSPLPQRLRIWVLGVYCFLVGLQPPVVRAMLRRTLSPRIERFGFTALQLDGVVILFIVALCPQWILSRSFLMSWMCGLAISMPRLSRYPNLELACKSYLFLMPFCWSAPISILWNTLLAPLVGGLLFPARLLTCLIPPIAPITNLLWTGFTYIVQHGPQAPQLSEFVESRLLAALAVVLHLLLLTLEVRWRRELAFS